MRGRAFRLLLELFNYILYNLLVNEYRVTYKSNGNVVYRCIYHVVWTPKYRRSVLVDGVDERLKVIISEVATETQCDLMAMEVMPDHVHLLVQVDPQFGVHTFVKRVKGRSSRLLRMEFEWLKSRIPTLWTNSYFCATVGGAPLEIVKQYVENQKHV